MTGEELEKWTWVKRFWQNCGLYPGKTQSWHARDLGLSYGVVESMLMSTHRYGFLLSEDERGGLYQWSIAEAAYA